MARTAGDRYHHGNLPSALKDAAVEVISERGPAGFSLREVSRRAGVSHAAPAHHFGDATGLLTAIAIDAFKLLEGAMGSAADAATTPMEALVGCGKAYVTIGVEHRAHLDLVFRPDLVNTDDPEYEEWGSRTYGRLLATLETVRDHGNPDLDVDTAARLCWSAMQGLLVLFPFMAKVGDDATEFEITEFAEQFNRQILIGLLDRSTTDPAR